MDLDYDDLTFKCQEYYYIEFDHTEDLTILSNKELQQKYLKYQNLNNEVDNASNLLGSRNHDIDIELFNLNAEFDENEEAIIKLEDVLYDLEDYLEFLKEEVEHRLESDIIVYSTQELKELGQQELFND